MKTWTLILNGMGVLIALTAASAIAEAPRPFDQRFPTISRRNIFDPERSRTARPSVVSTPRPAPPPTPLARETVRLLGVALTEHEAFAHFAGGHAPPVARTGDRLGEWRVAEIRADGVVLEAEGRTIELPVGRQLVRQGAGPWTVAAGDPPVAATGSASAFGGAPPPSSGGTTPSAPSGGMSEIMRRLMERRMREMGQ